jgi:DNA-binding response OmpR family regulator
VEGVSMKTILISDEDSRVRNLIHLAFTEHMGYRVIATSAGSDAVQKAREVLPDVVLVDTSLSDQNGYKVSKEIKSDPLLKNTYVILLTSAFTASNKGKAIKAYADDVIAKPFKPEEIIEKVEFLTVRKDRLKVLKLLTRSRVERKITSANVKVVRMLRLCFL